jgi:hypothetical protein
MYLAFLASLAVKGVDVRFAKVAVAAILIGMLELALVWRSSVLGLAPDLLFVLAAFACVALRPAEGVPVACGVGLVADFLLGRRLGLMALGFGIGARAIESLRPLLGRWGPGGQGRLLARAGGVFLLVLGGSGAAHVTVAILGALLAGDPGATGSRITRAVEIAFLTAAAAPFAWPVLVLALGNMSRPLGARLGGRAGLLAADAHPGAVEGSGPGAMEA